jgi:hypothetical protein
MKNNGIADFIKPTIITAQQYGTKVSVEIDHSDTDIDELFEAFQTICVGLGYHQSAWKNWIVDRADEYRETDAEDLKEQLTEWQTDELADVVFHNKVKWDEKEANERMDVIGQNGNEGLHYSNDGGFDGKPYFDLNDASEDDDLFEGIEPNEALKKAAEKYKKKLK